jgi:hypothetical protein
MGMSILQKLSRPFLCTGFLLCCFFSLQAVASITTARAQAKGKDAGGSVYTQVYSRNPKDCKDVDSNTVSEGEDVPQLCKGYGGYWLYRTSAVYRVKLAIQDGSRKFDVPVVAAENHQARVLEDSCVKKFGDKIEWLMMDGKPFAFILRVSYFKDTQDEQTVFQPQNRAGEFLFVRGLKGYERLGYEVSTLNSAFNANEQARLLAYRFYQEQPGQ